MEKEKEIYCTFLKPEVEFIRSCHLIWMFASPFQTDILQNEHLSNKGFQ